MDYLDFLKWLEKEQLEDRFNFKVQMSNKSSRVYFLKDYPVIFMNRKDLQSPFWRGTFFHELGHVIRPPKEDISKEFKFWKILEIAQILLLPVFNEVVKKVLMPMGVDYVIGMFLLFYSFKFLMNWISYPLSLYLYEMEYNADKFSHRLDENKTLLKKIKTYRYRYLFQDLFVRIVCPAFILWTHPMTILREKSLEKR